MYVVPLSRLILAAALALFTLVSSSTAHAQLVSDGETAIIDGVTNDLGPANLIIGTNGPNTTLIITNGGLVADASGNLGWESDSSTNQVIVTGGGSGWNNSGPVNIGNAGSFNTLLITNGGAVSNISGTLGHELGANNNQVVVSGAGSVWNSGGDRLLVGRNGSGNALLIENGGTVNNQIGFIGFYESASNSLATVNGVGSRWNNSASLFVGADASFNTLLVTNGGTVNNFGAGIGLNGPNGGYNSVIVSGADSMWRNSGALTIGDESSFNSLLIDNGGTVNNEICIMGFTPDGNNNQAVVSGVGSTWTNSNKLVIGSFGSFNSLLITNGGTVNNTSGEVGSGPSSFNNQVIVNGVGSAWNHTGALLIGNQGSFNTLLITGGGAVNNPECTIGLNSGSTNNQVIVSDIDSVWNNTGALSIGGDGSFNSLLITNQGAVLALSGVYVGTFSASADNCLTMAGGTLHITNVSHTATLHIRKGTNVLNAGLIETDQMVMENDSGHFDFNGGMLKTRGASVDNGLLFTVGNETEAATYLMSGGTASNHSFADDLRISGNGTLSGNGTIRGTLTVASGGTLSPGISIGKIVLNDSPVMQGNIFMEINQSGPTLTNDQIQVVNSLAYGGSLTVSNLGPDALALGDSFQLFSADNYSGAFSFLSLPTLPSGLIWKNNLLLDGSIVVANKPAPSINGISQSGTNLIFSVTGGLAGGSWDLLTSTDVASPVASWTTNISGIFDEFGNVNFTNAIDLTEPQRYFLINSP